MLKKITYFILFVAFICLGINASPNYDSQQLDRLNADSQTWYVGVGGTDVFGYGTPELPFGTIQYALANANPYDSIYVFIGTYYENVIWPFKEGMILVGEDKEYTIIDGNQNGSVITFNYQGYSGLQIIQQPTEIKNFTIKNGNSYSGGGIFCNSSSAKFTNLIIKENYANSGGGGMYLTWSNSTISNCDILNNNSGSSGGGITVFDSYYSSQLNNEGSSTYSISDTVIIQNTRVQNNEARFESGGGHSGGIYGYQANFHLRDVEISNNNSVNGGGSSFSSSSNSVGLLIMDNVIVNNNSANWIGGGCCTFGGGISLSNISSYFYHVEVSDNVGTVGGGIYLGNADLIANYLTMVNNTASVNDQGGGFSLWSGSELTLINSIIHHNIPNNIHFHTGWDPNSLVIAYSDISDGQSSIVDNDNGTITWLNGNIDDDPLFIANEYTDYALSYSDDLISPCIDSGTNYFEYEGDVIVDESNSELYYGPMPDMGAHEYYPPNYFGCMDSNACNYNPNATVDDGSCTYSSTTYDCDGNCLLEIDCLGVCGGSAMIDYCDVCDGGNYSYLECWDGSCVGDPLDCPLPECSDGFIPDCSLDGDCCPLEWIGNGISDCQEQAYGCDLSCYNNDGGDCGNGGNGDGECSNCNYDYTYFGSECCDSAFDEYGLTCTYLEGIYNWDCTGCNCVDDPGPVCGDNICSENEDCLQDCNTGDNCTEGFISDCSLDGDCCPLEWLGDGYCDGLEEPYGCNLLCYDLDDWDCMGREESSQPDIKSVSAKWFNPSSASNKIYRINSDHCGGVGPNVGCDGVCDSDVVYDECGVCGGNGTDCSTIIVPLDYPTIQAAIFAANAGDSILVSPGIYTENLIIEKDLILLSLNGASSTIIDGSQSRQFGSTIVIRPESNTTHHPEVEIKGFEIKNGKGTVCTKNVSSPDGGTQTITEKVGGGIFVYVSKPTIIENKLKINGDGNTDKGGAIYAASNSEDCDFSSRDYVDHPNLQPVTTPLNLSNNTFDGNTASDGHSIYISGFTNLTTDLTYGDYDVIYVDQNDPSIIDVPQYWVKTPDSYRDFSQSTGQANAITNDVWVDPVYGEDTPITIGSSLNPFLTIAFSRGRIYETTDNPITIYLNEGWYSESANGEEIPIVITSNLSLVGTGEAPSTTIIDGEFNHDNIIGIILGDDINYDLTLSNFTITGQSKNTWWYGNWSAAAIEMRSMDYYSTDSYAFLDNLIIQGNEGHGLTIWRANVVLNNITVTENGRVGMLLSNAAGGIYLYNSIIWNNLLGDTNDGSNIKLLNNSINNIDTYLFIDYTDIDPNEEENLHCEPHYMCHDWLSGSPWPCDDMLVLCFEIDNFEECINFQNTDGLCNWEGEDEDGFCVGGETPWEPIYPEACFYLSLSECNAPEFWFCEPYSYWGTELDPTYGDNVIHENPEFVNPSERNYSLQSTSPCIDTGTETFEYNGNIFTIPENNYCGDNPDMGAIEYCDESDFELGDLTGDGFLNVIDVVLLVDIILTDGDFNVAGDMNEDGELNVQDIVALVYEILNG